MLVLIRNKANGAAVPYAGNQGLLDHPDRYERYYISEPGDPPVDDFTGQPLGESAPVAREGAKANGTDSGGNLTESQRQTLILEAVVNIDPSNYGKPAGGRPALPKKAAVEALTGFKVNVDEIEKAVATKEALGLTPAPAVADAVSDGGTEDAPEA